MCTYVHVRRRYRQSAVSCNHRDQGPCMLQVLSAALCGRDSSDDVCSADFRCSAPLPGPPIISADIRCTVSYCVLPVDESLAP